MILETKRKAAEGEPEPGPSKVKGKRKKSSLVREKFISEIKDDEKNINERIFKERFFYQSPIFLQKELYDSNKNINEEIVKL